MRLFSFARLSPTIKQACYSSSKTKLGLSFLQFTPYYFFNYHFTTFSFDFIFSFTPLYFSFIPIYPLFLWNLRLISLSHSLSTGTTTIRKTSLKKLEINWWVPEWEALLCFRPSFLLFWALLGFWGDGEEARRVPLGAAREVSLWEPHAELVGDGWIAAA